MTGKLLLRKFIEVDVKQRIKHVTYNHSQPKHLRTAGRTMVGLKKWSINIPCVYGVSKCMLMTELENLLVGVLQQFMASIS